MTRVKRGYVAKRRRKSILASTAGACRAYSRLFRPANQQAMKAMVCSHEDRKIRKRDYRSLWIARINAAARQVHLTYSRLIYQLHSADVILNRKMLAQVVVLDQTPFLNLLNTGV
uniref:Large ribosomal subunit protein bL20c n=1 Tax=Mesotaenium endlicherianum TaxID=184485 RepID=A0A024B3S0_9VIRI|nr:ribosomal protein L20 [Mesotaenium endlicherianum]AHZ11184.1 ribosomal protein L20 [Mesotaenium endlicherianum]